jgi:hypothetical protein
MTCGVILLMLAVVTLVMPSTALASESTEDPPGTATAESPSPSESTEGGSPKALKSPEVPPGGDESDLGIEIDGYARQTFKWRASGSERDLDSYTDLVADVVVPGDLTIRGRLNGRLVTDLLENQEADDRLRDYWDSQDGDFHSRLYEAYVVVEDLMKGRATAWAGRQFIDEGNWFHFDGLRVDVGLDEIHRGLEATGLIGVPVTFDEENRSGNWIGGFVLRGKPSRETTLRFEYYHVSEEIEGFNDPVTAPYHQPVAIPDERIEDDLLGLSAWHRFGKAIRLYGRFSLLNGDANELHLRGRWTSEDGVWTGVLEYFQMFERLHSVTNDLSPGTPMLGVYEPYTRIGGRVDCRPDDHWLLQVGYSHRVLEDDDDEGTFNHEYDHTFGSVSALGVIDPRLDLTLTANAYASDLNDQVAAGGHADFRAGDTLTLSGGVDYALFKYDWFQDTEREDVWTYSLGGRWRYSKTLDFRARLTVDDDRFHTFTTFRLSATVRF